jgi:hypothetical protein
VTFKFPGGVLAQHSAILGKTGSGKTSTAKLMVEQVVAGDARVCVLDPIKSDWWGLTSSSDGKRPGLPFQILGGPRGHVPLHSSSGKAIGEIVANGALPLSIIDMADLEPGGQAKFFVDFAPTLIRKMRGVVYLVMEEAHLFAPKERSGIGAENMSIHWAKTLATAGRSKGIRLILVTQRTQALHNALLGSCETMIAHRMSAPADQMPVVSWLKANTDKATTEKVASSLSSTPTGSGWLCSGEEKLFELVKFPRIHTYDNSATPTGDSTVDQVKMAPVDADKLKAIIGDAVKTAEANDPAALKKQIAELQRQLKAAPAGAAPDPKAIDAAHNRGYELGFKQGSQDGQQNIIDQLEVYYGSLEGWAKVMPRAPVFKLDTAPRAAYTPPRSTANVLARVITRTTLPATKRNGHAPASDLPKGEIAVLSACIQYPDGLRREQITVLTGFKRSTRDAYVYRLKEKGFIEVNGETVTATEDGMLALPNAEPLPRGEELQQFWLNKLPQGERMILESLIEAFPKGLARDDVTERTGFKRSTRDAYIYRMAAKQLVTEPSRGEVRASEDLFS